MTVLFWIVSIALVAWEILAGIGKIMGQKMALDWMEMIGVSRPFMSAFGGLEVGAIGVILVSLSSQGRMFNQLIPYAVGLMIVLKVIELFMLSRAKAPSAAYPGPIVVMILTIAFYFLR